ncbi:hypothetical protein KY346_06100 [Candidatus Woesearchaeota archaeon]|nr:hypothetical protein [Candidatus Woesearchaeota archaeon]
MTNLVVKGTLEDLPVFDKPPIFDSDAEIFEEARIVYQKTMPNKQPPLRIQAYGAVIGRNPDCSSVYLLRIITEREDGKDGLHVHPADLREIPADSIESYVVLGEQANRVLPS